MNFINELLRAGSLLLVALLLVTMLGGCTGAPIRSSPEATPREVPAIPAPPPDANNTADAIPRAEPRSRYGNPASYEVFGQRYVVLASAAGYVARGTASWYGPGFHGERTSSGEPYDMYGMTAAHKTLPIPVYARVTNLDNGHSVVVRINDRGPFVGDRLIDLSWSAASRLDMLRKGTALVEVRVVSAPEQSASVPAAGAAPPTQVANGTATDTPTENNPATSVSPTSVTSASVTSASATAEAAPEMQTAQATNSATPAKQSAPLPVTAPADAGIFLQAASFNDVANAKRLLQRLAASGIVNVRIVAGESAGRPVWRVRVGPIASRAELDDYVERLSLFGIPDARVAHD